MKPNSLFKIPIRKQKWPRQLALALIGAGLLAGVAYSSSAASIAVSFIGRNGGDDILSSTDTAGVVSQPWWRNIKEEQPDGSFTGFEPALWDNTGNFTAISLDYQATDSWSSDGPTVTGNDKMMKGIIKAVRNNDPNNTGTRNDPAVFKINGLPAGGVYDIYVYIIENGTGAQGSVELGTVTNFIAVQNSFNGTFVQATSTTPGTYGDANYAKFSNVSIDAQGLIQITVRKDNPGSNFGGANDGVGIAGIQIVQVSGPAFPANTDSCSILTQPPATASAFAGASIDATVGTFGPCKVQWKKNGVDIAGATTSSLTLPVTVADNNAQVTAVVYNNVNSVTSAPMVLTVLAANKGIGFNFTGRDQPGVLAADESAGLVGQKNWFNVSVETAFSGTSELLAADGNTTMVKLTYVGSDSWHSGGGRTTPNEKLMKGILKANPSTDTAVPTDGTDKILLTVTNLPTGTYKVILYTMENDATGNNRALADVSLGSTTYYVWEQCVFGGTFNRATSTAFGTYEPPDANYVQFDNVTPTAGGTIAITMQKVIELPQVTDGIGVAGVQIVQLTGNGYPTNDLPVAIATDPQPTVAAAGKPATFSVAASGPFIKYQWKKNGVDIPGATTATYTFTTALADNNSTYRVLVWNNVNIISSLDAKLTVDVPTPPVLIQGFLQADRYEGIGGNTGAQGITDTINAAAAGPPTVSYGVPGPNCPQTSPDLSNFGVVVWGWVKPDVTGNYYFFTRSDDPSAVWINTVGATTTGTNSLPNPAVDTPICRENGCCAAFQEPGDARTSAPIPLEAGKYYGFMAIYKEAGGGDYMFVAWAPEATYTAPASALSTIPSLNCYTMASAAGHRTTLVKQPQSVSVIEGNPAVFTVGVEVMPATDVYAVQWLTNGVIVPGVNGPRYAINSTVLAQNNTQVKARVISLAGQTESVTVNLTVLADTFAPVPKAGVVAKNAGANQVGVGFNEAVNLADLVPANFTFVGPAGSSGTFRIVTNSLDTYRGVVFDTTGLSAGATGKVTVKNVRDLKGNAIPAAGVDATFTVTDFGFADTGAPIRPGQVVPVGTDGFDVLNGGRQEWNSYDEATIAYQQKTGNFDVKVRVMYAEPASQWARCGLMARYNLNAGEASGDGRGGANPNVSAYAQTHVNPSQTLASSGVWASYDPTLYAQPQNPTPNNGHEQNCRLATGATTSGWGSAGTAPTYPNAWLRLARIGSTIYGYRSEDGVNWVSQGSVTLQTQEPTMYVGPFFAVETGNIWVTTQGAVPPDGFDIWGNPFDPTYDRLFVANFRDFGPAAGEASNIKVGVIQDAVGKGDLVLIWTSGGVLQQATSLGGTWAPVPGAPSSPNGGRFEVPTTGSSMFYRVKVQ